MSRSRGDVALLWLLRACASAAAVILLLIVAFLVLESVPALRRIGLARFFADASWHPSAGLFNLGPMLVGTLLVSAGAVALAAPLGVASAVFCRHYAPPRLAALYRRQVELLAGIPSVVYGLWGLVVLVPLIARFRPPGPSVLAGALVLAVMILPTIALTAEAALAAVPEEHVRVSAALALSRGATVWGVLVPAARSGIFTGVLLGVGRAIGETMAVLMVCGNAVRTPASVFDPVRTLTANIALEMAYATRDHRSALFVSGLLLLSVVALLVLAGEALARRLRHA